MAPNAAAPAARRIATRLDPEPQQIGFDADNHPETGLIRSLQTDGLEYPGLAGVASETGRGHPASCPDGAASA